VNSPCNQMVGPGTKSLSLGVVCWKFIHNVK
jgi:hypothetical protein